MRLDFCILADKAEAINGKLYLMGGGFQTVAMAQIPGPASFDVGIGVSQDYHETSDNHVVSLTLEDADNAVILGPVTFPFATGRPPGFPPGDELRWICAVQGPFPIPAEGNYQVRVQVDAHQFEPTRFRVVRIQPQIVGKVG